MNLPFDFSALGYGSKIVLLKRLLHFEIFAQSGFSGGVAGIPMSICKHQ